MTITNWQMLYRYIKKMNVRMMHKLKKHTVIKTARQLLQNQCISLNIPCKIMTKNIHDELLPSDFIGLYMIMIYCERHTFKANWLYKKHFCQLQQKHNAYETQIGKKGVFTLQRKTPPSTPKAVCVYIYSR